MNSTIKCNNDSTEELNGTLQDNHVYFSIKLQTLNY